MRTYIHSYIHHTRALEMHIIRQVTAKQFATLAAVEETCMHRIHWQMHSRITCSHESYFHTHIETTIRISRMCATVTHPYADGKVPVAIHSIYHMHHSTDRINECGIGRGLNTSPHTHAHTHTRTHTHTHICTFDLAHKWYSCDWIHERGIGRGGGLHKLPEEEVFRQRKRFIYVAEEEV